VLLIADPSEAGELGQGDRITAGGRLRPPSMVNQPRELLFPRITLLESGGTGLANQLARARHAAIQRIEHYLPEPQASLAAGVLLGGSGRLSADFKLQLQRSGLAHIVAIDGFKQVIVTAVLAAFAVRLVGRSWSIVPILVGVLGYTLLTGARPSALRAALMVGSSSLAFVLGRLPDPLTGLLLAAVLMATVDPAVLLDRGFQLSFSATLGLILLWPGMRRLARGIPSLIAEPAGVTAAVTIATLPVTLSAFGSVSLISPLAHVLAVPLLPPLLISTALLALTSPLPAVAHLISWLVWLPVSLLVEIVRVCGSLPAAALAAGRISPLLAWLLAATLLAWALWQHPDAHELRECIDSKLPLKQWLLAPGACAALALVAALRPDGQIHAEPLAVAPGEAIFVRVPNGQTGVVARGKLNARALLDGVASNLSVLEHGLTFTVVLDDDADTSMATLLRSYPAEHMLYATRDERVDLGNGTALDVYSGASASLSYGDEWLPLLGQPPLRSAPTTSADTPEARD
jgi:competence protein ComEC